MNKSFAALFALASTGCYGAVPPPPTVETADAGQATPDDDAAVAAPDAAAIARDTGTVADTGASPSGDAGDVVPIPDGGSTSNAQLRMLFDQTVAPVLDAKCKTCHGPAGPGTPRFLSANLAQYYDVILGYRTQVLADFEKASASLITKIVPGPHFGTSYTPAERAAIETWLDAEKAATSGPPPPSPVELALAEWSGCMDFAEWDQLQVAVSWARLESDDGPCVRCHFNGQGNFIATDESRRMFDVLSTKVDFMLRYFAVNTTDPARPVIETNLLGIQAVGNGTPPYNTHPAFNAGPNTNAAQALEAFYQATVARKQGSQCGPSRLIPDPI